MFLKSLTISSGSNVIREINFRKGINLIVDESEGQITGNSVGKTTVLKLIDFCFGANKKIIWEENLLLNEGIGPPAPISHASILYYYTSRNLKNNIVELVNRVISNYQIDNLFTNKNINQINDFALRPYKKEKWGRIGIELFDNWNPSIFIGFLLDGQDHCTTPLLGEKSPDFSIIISFEGEYHNRYPNDETYKSLVKHLKEQIEDLNSGWDFYHHIEDDKVKERNFWHPIHIRKPMLHLFQGTEKGEEQEQRFIDATNEIITIIDDSEYFHELKDKHL